MSVPQMVFKMELNHNRPKNQMANIPKSMHCRDLALEVDDPLPKMGSVPPRHELKRENYSATPEVMINDRYGCSFAVGLILSNSFPWTYSAALARGVLCAQVLYHLVGGLYLPPRRSPPRFLKGHLRGCWFTSPSMSLGV